MPQIRDVDQQREEGAYLYKVGGQFFLAPEPSVDTIREVVRADTLAFAAAKVYLEEQVGSPGYDADRDPAANTLAGSEAFVPQLQLLLFVANEAGAYLHATYTPPEQDGAGRAKGPGTLEVHDVCSEGERVPIPAPWLKWYLSAKRCGQILSEVLGEGGGQR